MAKPPGVIEKTFERETLATRDISREPRVAASPTEDARVAQLRSEGYVQEGNLLKSPEQEYIPYWDKDPDATQTGTYSSHVVELDASGRIISETYYAPKLVEASSTGAWAIREIRETSSKTYDYEAGTVTTETVPSTPSQTFLATSQVAGSDVPVGRTATTEELAELRGETADVGVPTPTGEFGVFPTAIGFEGQVLYGAYAGADVTAYPGAKSGTELIRGDTSFRLYQESVAARTQMLAEAGATTAVQLFPQPTPPPSGSVLGVSQEFAGTALEGFARRVEQSMTRSEEFFGQEGVQRMMGVGEDVAELGIRWADFFLPGGRPPPESVLTMQAIGAGFVSWPILLGGAGAIVGERLAATGEAVVRPETRPQVLGELGRAGVETLKIYDPRTVEGAATLTSAAVFAMLTPGLLASARFMKQVAEPPARIKGRTYFGTQERVVKTGADVVRRATGIEVVEPGAMPFETRIVRKPVETLTLARAKDTFIVQEPSGRQVTTRLGRGEFQDYFARTVVEPSGAAKTQVFRAEPTETVLLRTIRFQAREGVLLTEPKSVFGEPRVEELKAYEATLRVRQDVETGRILPATREGPVPTGEFVRAFTERVSVRTDVPKLEFVKTERGLGLELQKTQFELVEYTPIPEKAFFEMAEGRVAAKKPVEFTQLAETRLGQTFDITFQELGKPPRPRQAVSPETPELVSKALAEMTKPREEVPTFKWPKPEPFTGEGRPSIDLRPERIRASTEMLLEKFDPYGISGDRLRPTVTKAEGVAIQRVQAARPEAPPLRDIRLFTEAAPRAAQAPFPVARIVPVPPTMISREAALLESTSLADAESLMRSEARSLSESMTEALSETRSLSESRSEALSESMSEALTESLSMTQTMTQTMTLAETPSIPLSIPAMPKPRPPTTMGMPAPLLFGLEKKKQPVFDVLVRESRPKGKRKVEEVRVNDEPLPYNAALNEADYYVDESSARTFRIVKVGEEEVVDQAQFLDAYKYRAPKGKTKLKQRSYVERTPFLIDSAGERAEITAKGLKALERKRKGLGRLF